MTTRTVSNHRYHEDYLALAAASSGPAWLADLRAAAWERFSELGFPTARRGNERWKYTAVAPVARVGFAFPFVNAEGAEPLPPGSAQVGQPRRAGAGGGEG